MPVTSEVDYTLRRIALGTPGASCSYRRASCGGCYQTTRNARRARSVMFAALTRWGRPIFDRAIAHARWSKQTDLVWERLPILEMRRQLRLDDFPIGLALPTGSTDCLSAPVIYWCDGATQLRRMGILDRYPNLSAYVRRGKRRPPTSVLSPIIGRFSLAQATTGLNKRFPPRYQIKISSRWSAKNGELPFFGAEPRFDLIFGCQLVKINGGMKPNCCRTAGAGARLLAFAGIYIIWGTTFLAIALACAPYRRFSAAACVFLSPAA